MNIWIKYFYAGNEVPSGLIYCYCASGAEERSRLFGGSACCSSVEPKKILSEGVSQLPQVAASSTPTGLDGGGSATLSLMVELDA